jgi:hypothetical protein
MSFVRIKNICNKEYGYLVENYWTSSGSRQKTKGYLGRVITYAPLVQVPYELPPALSYKELSRYLLAQELRKHGFTGSKSELTHDEVKVNLLKGTCTNRKRNVVIKINDGFVCAHTFKELMTFTPQEERFEQDLANCVVAAGINMPPELFISLYEAAKRKLKKGPSSEENQ